MFYSTQLNAQTIRLAVWLNQHPAAVKVAMVALPIALALAAALLMHDLAYACPVAGQGCSGGGT